MAERNERRGGAHVSRSAEQEREQRRTRLASEQRRNQNAQARHTAPEAQAERPARRPAEAPARRNDGRPQNPQARTRNADPQVRRSAAPARSPEETRRLQLERIARRKRKKTARRVKTVLILLLMLVILAGCGLVYLAIHVSESTTNFPNVYLNGIDVGGLTPGETLEKLNAAGWDEDAAEPMTVTLPMGVSFTLDRRTAGVALTAQTAAAAAYRFGHSQDAWQNLLDYVGSYTGKTDVALAEPVLDENYVRTETEKAAAEFGELVSGSSEAQVDLEAAEIRTVKGAGELSLNTEAIVTGVSRALLNDERSFSYEQIDGTPVMPDFARLYTELNVEPRSAYFADDGSFTVIDEVVGCTFDVAAAESAWQQAGLMEEVHVPLVITEPEVTGEALRGLLFRDVLGYQTTVFASSGENRINNIKLAASKIDGIVLMPGEVFSYNDTVGQRTKEAGFLEAGAYADGEVVQEVGGGICQVSSTLYCATLFANLETVSRTNHYFRVDYLPIGYDATVSWPKPDFKFRNNREYPIRIVAYTTNDTDLTVEIHGTNVDGSYVELSNEQWVVYDTTYPSVQIGWSAQVTRSIRDASGNLIATVKEPYGIYNKHAEDIDWPPEYYSGQAAAGDANVVFG